MAAQGHIPVGQEHLAAHDGAPDAGGNGLGDKGGGPVVAQGDGEPQHSGQAQAPGSGGVDEEPALHPALIGLHGGDCVAAGLKSGHAGVEADLRSGVLGLAVVVEGGEQGIELALMGAVEHAVDHRVVQEGFHHPGLPARQDAGGLTQAAQGVADGECPLVLGLVLEDHHAAGAVVFDGFSQAGELLKGLAGQGIVPGLDAVEEGELPQVRARCAAGQFALFQHGDRMSGPGQSRRCRGGHQPSADQYHMWLHGKGSFHPLR